MTEYEIRRKGLEFKVTVAPAGYGEDVSFDKACEVASILSRAWGCTLEVWRIDDMAWHLRDFMRKQATYDKGEQIDRGEDSEWTDVAGAI